MLVWVDELCLPPVQRGVFAPAAAQPHRCHVAGGASQLACTLPLGCRTPRLRRASRRQQRRAVG